MTLVPASKSKAPDCFYAAAFCLHLLLWVSVSGEEHHQFSVEVGEIWPSLSNPPTSQHH